MNHPGRSDPGRQPPDGERTIPSAGGQPTVDRAATEGARPAPGHSGTAGGGSAHAPADISPTPGASAAAAAPVPAVNESGPPLHQPLSPLVYAALALVAFVAAAALLLLFVRAPSSTQPMVFFVVLIAAAAAGAFAMFGAMRAAAVWQGKVEGGQLTIVGPVVLFLAVLLLGLRIRSPLEPFDIAVRPRDPKQRIVTKGELLVDIPGNRRRYLVPGDGEVQVTTIPAQFRDSEVAITPSIPGFQELPIRVRLSGRDIDLPLQPLPPVLVSGRLDPSPASGGKVSVLVQWQSDTSVGDTIVTPDANGRFSVAVPTTPENRVRITVKRDGFTVYDELHSAGAVGVLKTSSGH